MIFQFEDNGDNYTCDSVKSLIDFYKDMPKWYCNNILGIYFGEEEMLLAGEECFETDSLTKWSMGNRIVGGENASQLLDNMQKFESTLPAGSMGEVILERSVQELENLQKSFHTLTGDKETISVSVIFGEISGAVSMHEDTFISYTVSKNAHKGLLEHYINHLFLCREELVEKSFFIDKSGQVHQYKKIEAEKAEESLLELISYMHEHVNEINPFDIDTAGKFHKKSERYKTVKSLNTELNYRRNGFSGEYVNRMLPEFMFDENSYIDYVELCELILGGIDSVLIG